MRWSQFVLLKERGYIVISATWNFIAFMKCRLLKTSEKYLKAHKADMDNKIKHLQAAISVKIDDQVKDLQTYFDQEMANFINETNVTSDRLEIHEKTEKERSIFEPDTTLVCMGLSKQQQEDVDDKVETLILQCLVLET